MKTLLRVLLILTVASIIGGLMYVGVDASTSTAVVGGTLVEGEGILNRSESAEFRPDHDEDRDEGGFGFPRGIVKAVVLMSVAGGVYSAIVWSSKRSKSVASS